MCKFPNILIPLLDCTLYRKLRRELQDIVIVHLFIEAHPEFQFRLMLSHNPAGTYL